jgi:hypothetical protein
MSHTLPLWQLSRFDGIDLRTGKLIEDIMDVSSEYCGCRHAAGLWCATRVPHRDLIAGVLCERVNDACGPPGFSLSVTHR